jgi:hypothetical protein
MKTLFDWESLTCRVLSVCDASNSSSCLLSTGDMMPSITNLFVGPAIFGRALAQMVPQAAQIVDQKSFNVLDVVPPPSVANASTVCLIP